MSHCYVSWLIPFLTYNTFFASSAVVKSVRKSVTGKKRRKELKDQKAAQEHTFSFTYVHWLAEGITRKLKEYCERRTSLFVLRMFTNRAFKMSH